MKLTDIYTEDELNQEDELLFHVASEEVLMFDFEVRTLSHASLSAVMTHRGDASVIDSMSLYATLRRAPSRFRKDTAGSQIQGSGLHHSKAHGTRSSFPHAPA